MLLLVAIGCAEESTAVTPAPTPAQAARPMLEDDDVWAMVPAEADLVLFADLAKLRQSPWTGETFAKVAARTADTDPAVEQIRAMDRVLFAKVPALRDGATVLIAQGAVDREGLRRGFAQGQGDDMQRSTYRGAELLVHGDEALAFVGKRTVVSGFTLAVRAAIDSTVGIAAGIETEPWLRHLRGQLEHGQGTPPVASLYVHLQPATRQALKQEMGEGDALEDFGTRIDLGADLDAIAIGVTRTDGQARDMAARLAERVRDVRTRPIVAAFGLGSVLDSLRFSAKDTHVQASLHVSNEERGEIAARMSMVAETLAAMRGQGAGASKPDQKASDERPNQERKHP